MFVFHNQFEFKSFFFNIVITVAKLSVFMFLFYMQIVETNYIEMLKQLNKFRQFSVGRLIVDFETNILKNKFSWM